MSLLFDCPLGAEIPDVPPTDCPIHFGQIVRIGLQRVGYEFTDILDEAEWNARLAANDDTKIVLTPITEGITLPSGELITEGGDDNTTAFGQPAAVGRGIVNPAGNFRGLSGETARALRSYLAESASFGQFGIYLINEFGQIIANDPNETGAGKTVFPIQNWFISSVGSEGFNTNNKHNLSWTFTGDWDEFFELSARTTTNGWDIRTKPNP